MERRSIRIATPDDAELLAELAARTFSDTFAVHNRPEDMKAYMDEAFGIAKQREEIDDARSTILLAFDNDEAAGYARLYAGDAPASVAGARPVELARLYADRRWHGSGVGRELLERCFDRARAAGFETIWLGVWERNERAIAFYQKHGFEECGSHVFQLGSDPQIDLLMARPLAEKEQ
jgi:ribosomal protein S18 acetylase RimI-like enzyme